MLGISRADYSRMTFADYMAKVDGWQLAEQKKWEHTRFLSMMILNGYSKRHIKDPSKLMKLPLIDKDKKPDLTVEQMRNAIALAKMMIPN